MRVFFMIVALGLAGPVAGLSVQPTEQSHLRLMILAPWQDASALAVEAGGRLVGPERALFAALVEAPDPATFDAAVRELGAIWVRDGAAIATLCGVTL